MANYYHSLEVLTVKNCKVIFKPACIINVSIQQTLMELKHVD